MLAEYAPLSSAIISNKQEIKTFPEVLPHLLLQILEIPKDWIVKERFKFTEGELTLVTKIGELTQSLWVSRFQCDRKNQEERSTYVTQK